MKEKEYVFHLWEILYWNYRQNAPYHIWNRYLSIVLFNTFCCLIYHGAIGTHSGWYKQKKNIRITFHVK